MRSAQLQPIHTTDKRFIGYCFGLAIWVECKWLGQWVSQPRSGDHSGLLRPRTGFDPVSALRSYFYFFKYLSSLKIHIHIYLKYMLISIFKIYISIHVFEVTTQSNVSRKAQSSEWMGLVWTPLCHLKPHEKCAWPDTTLSVHLLKK